MARDRHYVEGETAGENDPQAVQFAQRLNTLLFRKGWKQADLVRAAKAHLPPGTKGFGRHLVSSYIRGKHMPNAINASVIARALGVPLTELIPEGAARIVGKASKDMQMSLDSTSGMARLKFDMDLPADVALQIMTLVNKAQKNHN